MTISKEISDSEQREDRFDNILPYLEMLTTGSFFIIIPEPRGESVPFFLYLEKSEKIIV